jgi:2-amino-4-hydroxy-6-hydroxymethyldihydropteridine diphosphokinase
MTIGYLGLGSNVGDRRAQLQEATDLLGEHGVTVVASSSTYDTDPVGEILDQPSFLNACLRIETDLEPEALLDACKAVERELGRAQPGEGYVRHGPRPIDVDLLLELDFELATPDGTRLSDALAALPVEEGVRREGSPLSVPRRA